MNATIKNLIRKTKGADVQDRLRLVGDVQDGLAVTEAPKKLGMNQPRG